MNLQEFIRDLADVEGKENLEKYVKDFWKQASNEDRAAVIQGIETLSGHLRKVVKSFWELCGIAYSNNWITVDGKTYAITPEIKPDDGRGQSLYKLTRPEKDDSAFDPYKNLLQNADSVSVHIGDLGITVPKLTMEQVSTLQGMTAEEGHNYISELLEKANVSEETRRAAVPTIVRQALDEIKNQGTTKSIRTLAGGVRSEINENGRNVIKNDINFKVRGE